MSNSMKRATVGAIAIPKEKGTYDARGRYCTGAKGRVFRHSSQLQSTSVSVTTYVLEHIVLIDQLELRKLRNLTTLRGIMPYVPPEYIGSTFEEN